MDKQKRMNARETLIHLETGVRNRNEPALRFRCGLVVGLVPMYSSPIYGSSQAG